MDINKMFYRELEKVVLESLIDWDTVRYMINDLNENEKYEIFECMIEQLNKEGKGKEIEDYFMNKCTNERLSGYFKKFVKKQLTKKKERTSLYLTKGGKEDVK